MRIWPRGGGLAAILLVVGVAACSSGSKQTTTKSDDSGSAEADRVRRDQAMPPRLDRRGPGEGYTTSDGIPIHPNSPLLTQGLTEQEIRDEIDESRRQHSQLVPEGSRCKTAENQVLTISRATSEAEVPMTAMARSGATITVDRGRHKGEQAIAVLRLDGAADSGRIRVYPCTGDAVSIEPSESDLDRYVLVPNSQQRFFKLIDTTATRSKAVLAKNIARVELDR